MVRPPSRWPPPNHPPARPAHKAEVPSLLLAWARIGRDTPMHDDAQLPSIAIERSAQHDAGRPSPGLMYMAAPGREYAAASNWWL